MATDSNSNSTANTNSNDRPDEAGNQNGNGSNEMSMRSSLEVSSALDRTILDSADFSGDVLALVTRYQVSATGPEETVEETSTDGGVNLQGLAPGGWTINVDALNADDTVLARGMASVELTPGSNAAVAVSLTPQQRASGQVSIQLQWPVGSVEAISSATLTPVGGMTIDVTGELVLSSNGATLSRNLPSARYALSVTASVVNIEVADELRSVVVTDAVITTGAINFELAPDPGFGTLSGPCRVLSSSILADNEPRLVSNDLDFGVDAFDPSDVDDVAQLTPGAQELVAANSSGGSNLGAEVFAYEALARCESAELVKTEDEIVYDSPSPEVDFSVSIGATAVGVSVTRICPFPPDTPFLEDDCQPVLEDKLGDLQQASVGVSSADGWTRTVLQVMAEQPQHATACTQAWDALAPAIRGETLVWLTVAEGDDRAICNR
ncbi:MAG: hypothetical protein AAF658_05985 [Myxococcota bacterium]